MLGENCLRDEAVTAWLHGRLPSRELSEAREHTSRCDACFALVATARTEANATDRGLFGTRYALVERLGAGSMGVVFRAHDRLLDRQVALKLLQPRAGGASRLLRESKAMAKLRHPNVAVVHDIVVSERGAFIAMEYIPGGTLRQWLDAAPPRAEILAMFAAVAQGLTAAHEAGVVHCDFKPENVLVDAGRVPKVTDFGLANPLPGVYVAEEHCSTATTRGGGTPAYMAPEQFGEAPVDRSADVFAFSVALWEALAEVRPFDETTLRARVDAAASGRIDPPPPGSIPPELEAALRRGLAADPRDRPESPLDIVRTATRPRRRFARVLLRSFAVTALGGGLWVAASDAEPTRQALSAQIEACVESAWDGEASVSRLEDFEVPTIPAEGLAFTEAVAALRGFVAELATMHRSTCRSSVLGEVSPSEVEMRQLCLAGRERALGVILEQTTASDAGALGFVKMMQQPRFCEAWAHDGVEHGYLVGFTASDEDAYLRIAEARVLDRLGMLGEEAREGAMRAASTGHPWLRAHAELTLSASRLFEESEGAPQRVRRSIRRLHELGDHASEATGLAALELFAGLTGAERAPYEIRTRAAISEITDDRLKGPPSAAVALNDLLWAVSDGDVARAPALAARAMSLAAEEAPSLTPSVARVMIAVHDLRGEVDEGLAARRTLADLYAAQGDFARSETLDALDELCTILLMYDRDVEARVVRERLTDALPVSAGAEEPPRLRLLTATLRFRGGDLEGALASTEALRRALPATSDLSSDLDALQGEILLASGRSDLAASFLEGYAGPLDWEHEGAMTVSLVDAVTVLGRAYVRLGRLEDARALLEPVARWQNATYPALVETTRINVVLAFAELDGGEFASARQRFERALDGLESGPLRAWGEFGHALASAPDAVETRRIAAASATQLRGRPRYAGELARVDAWLREH